MAAKASPSGLPWPSTMPSMPSSPITPPQSVLSRSSTRHFFARPCRAATRRPTSSPYMGAAGRVISCLERCHSPASCQAVRPSRAARSSRASRSTPAASAIGRSSAFSRAMKRAREPGRRCSLPPSKGGCTGRAVCWITGHWNAVRARCQQWASRSRICAKAASASSASRPACTPAARCAASSASRTRFGRKACRAEAGSSSSWRYWP